MFGCKSDFPLGERYKYLVFIIYMKFSKAMQLAKSYIFDLQSITFALLALQEKYGKNQAKYILVLLSVGMSDLGLLH